MMTLDENAINKVADAYLTAYAYAMEKVGNPNLAIQCGYCIVSCYMEKLKQEVDQQSGAASLGLVLASMAAVRGKQGIKKKEERRKDEWKSGW